MNPSDMYNRVMTLTVWDASGNQTAQWSNVACRVGQLYMGFSATPNFNAKVGVSIYFSLTEEQQVKLRPHLLHDDTRIKACMSDSKGECYEIFGVQNYDGVFYKCPANLCERHGDGWQ